MATKSASTYYQLKDLDGKTLALEVTVSGLSDAIPDNEYITDLGDQYILVKDENGVNTWEIHTARYADTLEPGGFTDGSRESSSIYTEDSGKLFTVSGVYSYWAGGNRYQLASGIQTVNWTEVEGQHFFYFSSDGVLQTTKVWDESILKDGCYIASIYWDNVTKEVIYLGDERHGCTMDSSTQTYMHELHGAQYVNGLALSDMTVDGDGDSDSHAQCGYEAGVIREEDLSHIIDDVTGPATIPMFCLSGVSNYWRRCEADAFPLTTISGGRAVWNEYTGGAWQHTEVDNNDFLLTHLFATNDADQPIVGIMGQAEYNTAKLARLGAVEELNSLVAGTMPSEEFVPIASVIFQTSDSYANAVKSRIVSTDEGCDYLDWRTTTLHAAGGVTSHSSLADLSHDDHIQYVLVDGSRGFTSKISGVAGTEDYHLTTKSYVDGEIISDHGGLGGLADDDHTQYLLVDGSRATTGAISLAGAGMTDDLGMAKNVLYFDEFSNGTVSKPTVNLDWRSGNNQKATLGASITFSFAAPPGEGDFRITLIQDGIGSRTVTWPSSVKWPGGTAPTLSSGPDDTDIIRFYYNGTNYFGDFSLDYS